MSPRTAVSTVFAANGVFFSTLVSRLADVRSDLGLSDGSLGLLLLSGSSGAVLGLPFAGLITRGLGHRRVVRLGALACLAGLVVAALAVTVLGSVPLTVVGLFVNGFAVSAWDVAQNLEGAEVERLSGRTMMPRFHAAWSVGSIAGGAIGVVMAAASVPMLLHLGVVLVLGAAAVWWSAGAFLPVPAAQAEAAARPRSAWLEPRTLLIGVMVLCYATVEGTANDWLSLAVIDGYHVAHWVGVAGFWLFTICMFSGRVGGPGLLDRWGRAPVLWSCACAAAVGVLVAVFAGRLWLAAFGIAIWGLGASLGFPVGMSAAADDPARAAARVSVVSTIGYGAFLIFPPLLGDLSDHVGTLHALLVVAVLMVPAALVVGAVRRRPAVA